MWVFFFFLVLLWMSHMSPWFPTFFLSLSICFWDWGGWPLMEGSVSNMWSTWALYVSFWMFHNLPSIGSFFIDEPFFLCPFICLTSSCEHLGHTDRTMTRASGVLVASSLKLGRFMSGHLCAKPLHMEISIFPKDIMSKTRRIMKKNDRYLEGNKQGLPLLSNSLKAS